MTLNREEFLNQLLESSSEFTGCSLEQLDVFKYDFSINFTTISGVLMSRKGAINPDDLELYSEEQVARVLQDLASLKSFVEHVAGNKCSHSDEATRLLKSLHNETI